MNKKIIQMHKATIVKITFLGLIVFFGCKAQTNDNNDILKLVLKDLKYEKQDSVFLKQATDNKKTIAFFRHRNTKEFGLRYAFKDDRKVENDSLFYEYDTIIYTHMQVKNDSYLLRGKGVSEKPETFLKDSFNYKLDSIKWDFSGKEYNVFNEDELKNGQELNVSKPVYNLKKDKAIVFKSLQSSNKKAIGDRAIYFFQKNEDSWKLVFQQKE